jgi:hypothetical protein
VLWICHSLSNVTGNTEQVLIRYLWMLLKGSNHRHEIYRPMVIRFIHRLQTLISQSDCYAKILATHSFSILNRWVQITTDIITKIVESVCEVTKASVAYLIYWIVYIGEGYAITPVTGTVITYLPWPPWT